MKVSYDGDGIICDFILMTVGEKGTITQKKGKGRAAAAKHVRPALEAASSRSASVVANDNPQPPEPARNQKAKASIPRPSVPRPSQFEIRPLPNQPPSTLRSESMFLPQDDDHQWEPVNADDDEDEGENARLEWDASNDPVFPSLFDFSARGTNNEPQNPSTMRISNHYGASAEVQNESLDRLPSGLEPTQRLSQVGDLGLDYNARLSSTNHAIGSPIRSLLRKMKGILVQRWIC